MNENRKKIPEKFQQKRKEKCSLLLFCNNKGEYEGEKSKKGNGNPSRHKNGIFILMKQFSCHQHHLVAFLRVVKLNLEIIKNASYF